MYHYIILVRLGYYTNKFLDIAVNQAKEGVLP